MHKQRMQGQSYQNHQRGVALCSPGHNPGPPVMAVQALVGLIFFFYIFENADTCRGCVTPKQIDNLIESSGGDTEMVDGYDDLPAEYQEKIDYALANRHVHDDDWNGVS